MLVDVALPLPLFRTFAYEASDDDAARACVGARVIVPFRNGREVGIVVGPATARAGVVPKPIISFPDDQPVLPPTLVALGRWMADYYVAPLGLALRTMLPSLLTGAVDPVPAPKTRRVACLARDLPSLMRRDAIFARAPQQRALFELIESAGGRAPIDRLLSQLRFSPSVLKGLVARGLATIETESVSRDPFANRPARSPTAHVPTPEQQRAIAAVTSAAPGEVFLLHGITGSGKTLVYIELLEAVVRGRGQAAIVLVPEIALTPQTVDRFRAVFGDQVAVLHSALSDGERYDAWLALRRGHKRIAVGARSAIFAPLANVGAIVVDEEHESSYKQGESPRYHARELAIVRARAEGAVVVLGSATPSLESWTNGQQGKFRVLSLPARVGGGSLPAVEVVDMRRQNALPPDPLGYVISPPLERALGERLSAGEQSILLLNRRGYASFVQCGACGDVPVCPDCAISLTYHRTPERLVCHYCQRAEAPRTTCRRCGGLVLRQRGLGTQQLERVLAERFASARIVRMDVDTTSAKWAHTEILDRVASGEVDILLGTQMIAKGLDFPNVTLVGVVDADVGINLPDFRASERCFQLLSQVAGRAGRGPKGGRVVIQTRAPAHHAVRCAVAHDYLAFVREELAGRAQPPYPPNVRLANVVFSGHDEEATAELAERASVWLHALLAKRRASAPDDAGGGPLGIEIVGPAPCPVERVKKRWRWHLLLKASQPRQLTRIARYFVQRFPIPKSAHLRVTVDRDPVALL